MGANQDAASESGDVSEETAGEAVAQDEILTISWPDYTQELQQQCLATVKTTVSYSGAKSITEPWATVDLDARTFTIDT